MVSKIILLVLSASVIGCGSKLVVRSVPADANLSILIAGSKEPKVIGKTPVEITDKVLEQTTKIDPNSGFYYELIFEKEGYQQIRIAVPSARFIPLTSYVDVTMYPGSDETRVASQMVQLLLNAQKFASTAEYERAQVEIDKVLEIDPKFTRAMTMRGSIYFLQSKFDESLKWYEKALAIDSKLDEAVKMISEIKKKIGDQSNAN